jgi:hypothetical protein
MAAVSSISHCRKIHSLLRAEIPDPNSSRCRVVFLVARAVVAPAFRRPLERRRAPFAAPKNAMPRKASAERESQAGARLLSKPRTGTGDSFFNRNECHRRVQTFRKRAGWDADCVAESRWQS